MTDFANLTIGVLALQGAFAEHVAMIERLGATTREVRLPADLRESLEIKTLILSSLEGRDKLVAEEFALEWEEV